MVEPEEQNRLQGESQSIQALARIIGPLIEGQLCSIFGHVSPYIMGIILVILTMITVSKNVIAVWP